MKSWGNHGLQELFNDWTMLLRISEQVKPNFGNKQT